MSAAIVARGLTKRFGPVTAVDGLGLDVHTGEVYAFLGRNGVGKTTTIRMILGLAAPTAGEVRVLGADVGRRPRTGRPGPQSAGSEARRWDLGRSSSRSVFGRVGYLVETATAYGTLTVHENLEIQRRLTAAPAAAVDDAIERLGLAPFTDRRADRLSLGNKQRLSLARALLHRPDLLVLDEPSNGLDPAGIVEVRRLLRSLATESGVTVFLSSHILSEVGQLADRVGIIHQGRLLEELDRDGLHARSRPYLQIACDDAPRARDLLSAAGFRALEPHEGGLRVFDGDGRGADVRGCWSRAASPWKR